MEVFIFYFVLVNGLVRTSGIAEQSVKPVWTPLDFLENQPSNLTCSTSADASPTPRFTWWMSAEEDGGDTRQLDGDSHDWNDGSLLYNNLTFLPNRTQHGVYVWCQVDHDVFNVTLRSDNHTIYITYGPGKPVLEVESLVYAGTNMTLRCSFTSGSGGTGGNPSVNNITWYHYNNTILPDVTGNETLVPVDSVTQEGIYSCSGTNLVATGPQSDPVDVTVLVLPHIVEPTEVTYVTVSYDDTTSVLSCLASGKPDLNITWFKDGEPIEAHLYAIERLYEAGNYSYDVEDGWRSYVNMSVDIFGLTCENITQFDGQYQCQASHTDKTSQLSPPIALTTQYSGHWSRTPPRPYIRSPGDSVSMVCDVCMEPPGNVTWHFNGQTNSIYATGRNLTLVSITDTDYGIYTCVASNVIDGHKYSVGFDIDLQYPDTGIELWIIIVASVAGFLVLIVVVIGVVFGVYRYRQTVSAQERDLSQRRMISLHQNSICGPELVLPTKDGSDEIFAEQQIMDYELSEPSRYVAAPSTPKRRKSQCSSTSSGQFALPSKEDLIELETSPRNSSGTDAPAKLAVQRHSLQETMPTVNIDRSNSNRRRGDSYPTSTQEYTYHLIRTRGEVHPSNPGYENAAATDVTADEHTDGIYSEAIAEDVVGRVLSEGEYLRMSGSNLKTNHYQNRSELFDEQVPKPDRPQRSVPEVPCSPPKD